MSSEFAVSFRVVATAYANDVDCLLQHRGVDDFNISSYLDDGSDIRRATVSDVEHAWHPATGPTGSVHFALGHAIELLLKVILLKHGASLDDVKKHGHDLKKAADAVASHGISVPDRQLIESFSPVHKGMDYRYPQAARVTVHDPNALRETVRKLDVLAA